MYVKLCMSVGILLLHTTPFLSQRPKLNGFLFELPYDTCRGDSVAS